MTSAVDERGVQASPKFWGSADGVARLVPHHVQLEHRSGLVAFDWAVARGVLRLCLVADQRLRAHPHQRETAPMRAEAPAKMPRKLIDCRDPL